MENQNAESTLTFEVNVKLYNKEKGELIDAIAAGSKLTKADAGRFIENPKIRKVEEWFMMHPILRAGTKANLV